jgi:hypothetical protein
MPDEVKKMIQVEIAAIERVRYSQIRWMTLEEFKELKDLTENGSYHDVAEAFEEFIDRSCDIFDSDGLEDVEIDLVEDKR